MLSDFLALHRLTITNAVRYFLFYADRAADPRPVRRGRGGRPGLRPTSWRCLRYFSHAAAATSHTNTPPGTMPTSPRTPFSATAARHAPEEGEPADAPHGFG